MTQVMAWSELIQAWSLIVVAVAVVVLVWLVAVIVYQEQRRLRQTVEDFRVTNDQAHQALANEIAEVRAVVEKVPPLVVQKLAKVLPGTTKVK